MFKRKAAKNIKIFLITIVLGYIMTLVCLSLRSIPNQYGNKWEPSVQNRDQQEVKFGNKVNLGSEFVSIHLEREKKVQNLHDDKFINNQGLKWPENENIPPATQKISWVYSSTVNQLLYTEVAKFAVVEEKTTKAVDMKDHDIHTKPNEKKRPKVRGTPENYMKDINFTTKRRGHRFVTMHPPKGQLGNQMFQLAVLYGLASKTNHIPFLSAHFPELDSVFVLPSELYMKYDTSCFDNLIQNEALQYKDLLQINKHLNWTLDGYFQFYPMFGHIEHKVRAIFKFKPLFVKIGKDFIKRNVPMNHVKVGIHVRRGDFISSYQQSLGRTTPDVDYFDSAKEFYRARYKNITFIVVSDDKQWCRKNLMSSDTVLSDHNHKGSDLAILSMCDHTIISVGSFGWWGAWLAGGTVVYYGQQYRPGSELDKLFVQAEYYPATWIKF